MVQDFSFNSNKIHTIISLSEKHMILKTIVKKHYLFMNIAWHLKLSCLKLLFLFHKGSLN